MSAVLDECPGVLDLLHRDLTRNGALKETGRDDGMTTEQVLRALVVRQMRGFSYRELAFHLIDSLSYRAFCRIGVMDEPPKKSTLQKNIKALTAETLEAVNRVLLGFAEKRGIETGERVRFDCTVTATDIHPPDDSWQLWDVVRVLVRVMKGAKQHFGVVFRNRSRRAKRRHAGIQNAKTNKERTKLYRDLLGAAGDCLDDACHVAHELEARGAESSSQDADLAVAIARQLRHYIALGRRVWEQTHRRVVCEEKVPATQKVVSIFEDHTDIIIKARRETLFGHKLCLETGGSGLVLDCVVLEGNPADSTLAVEMVKRHKQRHAEAPQQVAFDGGFSSKSNLVAIKAEGVQDVVFTKGRGLKVSDMVRDSHVFKCLRNFRAGIEAGISFLKRCFGLRRCIWKGLASFKSYVWAGVVSANLLLLARHRMAAAR